MDGLWPRVYFGGNGRWQEKEGVQLESVGVVVALPPGSLLSSSQVNLYTLGESSSSLLSHSILPLIPDRASGPEFASARLSASHVVSGFSPV